MMRLLRRDGALTIRDIEDDVLTEKEHLWQSRKPSKRALQLAFYTGEVTISERTGMLKTYELMTRHFGWDKPPKPASTSGDHGLSARPRVALAGRRQPRFDLPSRRAEQGGGSPPDRGAGAARGTGAGRARRRRQAGALGAARGAGGDGPRARRATSVHILSPFDPLIIQRKRTESLLRLRPPLRGLCAEGKARVRLFRAAGAGRRRDRRRASTSRPTARTRSC